MAVVPQWFLGPRRAWPWSCLHAMPGCPEVAGLDGGLAPTGGFAAWGVPWEEVRARCPRSPWVLHQGQTEWSGGPGTHAQAEHSSVYWTVWGTHAVLAPALGSRNTWEPGTLS